MVCIQLAKRSPSQMKQNVLISSLVQKQGKRSKGGWLWCYSTTIRFPLSRPSVSCYHSSSIQQSRNNDDKEEGVPIKASSSHSSRDWIPPQRPLSGDLGKSQIYATKMKPEPKDIPSSPLESFTEEESMFFKALQEKHENDNETAEFVNLDDLDIEAFRKHGSGSADGNANTGFINLEDFDLETLGKYFEEEKSQNPQIDQDDLDYDDLFENDEVLAQLINDPEFDADDDELLNLQMEMIDERLNEIKEEMKQKNLKQKETKEKDEEKKAQNVFDFITEDNSELDEFLKEQNSKSEDISSPTAAPDWLSTRRSKLSPSDLLTPEETSRAQRLDSEIPIIKDTLLSSNEIVTCLNNLGAIDVKHITPDEKTSPYFGWKGLIIATGTSYSHIRILTDSIVKNLRKRDLAKKGVVGAIYGSDGGVDTSSARRRRGLPKKVDDGWIAVDCGNYIVHVQDDITRQSLDLEGLWSPGERGRAGRELRNLNTSDEDAVDDYIARNPVPEKYTQSLVELSSNFWGDGQMRGGLGNIGKTKSGRWTPNSNQKRKFKNRGKR